MANNFKQKYGDWAVVTGATSGIGAELADQIASRGVNVVLVARKAAELERYGKELETKHNIKTKIISADLATGEGIEAVKQVDEEIGLLAIAAGLEVNGAFEKTPLDKEVKVIQLNVVATFHLAHHFSRAMVKRSRGGILFISSLSGHMPNAYFANYAATKSYVLNLGASLYGELRLKGVDVTVLSPGLTNTPMVVDNGMDWSKTPMKPMDPAVVAKAALDGMGKRVVTIPGIRNKLMAWVIKHIPIKMASKSTEKMVSKAIDKNKI